MFFKRLVDIVAVVFLFAVVYTFFFASMESITTHLEAISPSSSFATATGALGLLFGSVIIIIAVTIFALQVVFDLAAKGNGVLYKRVRKNDTLRDKEGKAVHVFQKDAMIWRFDPVFSKGKLPSRPQRGIFP